MTTELKTLTDLRENFTSEEWTKYRMGIIKHEEILRELNDAKRGLGEQDV